MGQRMRDEPIVYSDDDCAIWDPGESPKYLYIRFIGIEKCPAAARIPPNDRAFRVEQDVAAACHYFFTDDTWNIQLDLNAAPDPTTILLMDVPAGEIYFDEHHAQVIVEGRVYHNESVGCPFGQGGKNGICVVTWSPQATALLEAMNIAKGDDLFMELFPLANGKLVYKFCRLIDSTNIKFLLEP